MQRRVLARSLEPLPEESLPGYLLRLAYRLHRSPGRMAELCGIHDGRQRRLAADHLLGLSDGAAAEFARVTRLTPNQVSALGLRRYAETYPALRTGRGAVAGPTARRSGSFFGSIKDLYSDRWAVNFSSRFCSACLRGDGSPVQNAYGGSWNLRWHLPVVFACTTHQQLLAHSCPQCRRPLNQQTYQGRAALLLLPTTSHRLHPLQCRNYTVDRNAHVQPCGAHLDTPVYPAYAGLPAADHARLLALQARMDSRLASPTADGETQRGPELLTFQDLVDTAQLIKLSWPAARDMVPSSALATLIDDHTAPLHTSLRTAPSTTSSHFSPLRSAPQDSAQCGALLLTAEALHREAPDATALRERIRPLAQYAFENAPAGACRAFFSRTGLSTSLSRAMARRMHGFYAAGPLEYANLRVPSRECRFTVEEVPSHLPQAWYDAYFKDFADYVPGAGIYTVRHVRRAASLKLVEMTAGGSWRDSARALDIPDSRALSALNKLRSQVDGADLWPRFEYATERIARHLDELPQRTNYARRRRQLANWLMPESDWLAIGAGLPLADRLTTHRGTAVGTVLIWTEVTQSDHLLCPLLQTLRQTKVDYEATVDEIRLSLAPANPGSSRVHLHQRIHTYARELAIRIDTGHSLEAPVPPLVAQRPRLQGKLELMARK